MSSACTERATVSGSPRSVELKLEQLSQNRDRAERDARHFELIVQELSGKRDELAHEVRLFSPLQHESNNSTLCDSL